MPDITNFCNNMFRWCWLFSFYYRANINRWSCRISYSQVPVGGYWRVELRQRHQQTVGAAEGDVPSRTNLLHDEPAGLYSRDKHCKNTNRVDTDIAEGVQFTRHITKVTKGNAKELTKGSAKGVTRAEEVIGIIRWT